MAVTLDRIAEEYSTVAKGFTVGASAGILVNIIDHYTSMAASTFLYGHLGTVGERLLHYHRVLENDVWYPAGVPLTAAGIIAGLTLSLIPRRER